LCLNALVNVFNYTIEQIKQNYTGSILLVSSTDLFHSYYPPLYKRGDPERSLLDLSRLLNLSAIFTYNTVATEGATGEVLLVDRSWCGEMHIPILETGLRAGPELVEMCNTNATAQPIMLTLTPGDYNDWMYLKRGWFLILWRIVATLMCAVAGSLAGAKLIAYVRIQGIKATVPQVTLGIQFFAALFRISLTSTDPIYAGFFFNGAAAHMTTTIHFPLNFITILLLALYWNEMLNESRIHVTQFLTKLKIPFIIACILLIGFELFSTLLRALPYTGFRVAWASTIAAVLYIVFMLTMSVLFFVFGFKVIRRLKNARETSNMKGGEAKSDASLRRLTYMIVTTGFFNLVFISAFFIAAVDSAFYHPRGFHASWTLMYLGLLGASISQVAAVKWPEKPTSSRQQIAK
jgi:hypothetical protein